MMTLVGKISPGPTAERGLHHVLWSINSPVSLSETSYAHYSCYLLLLASSVTWHCSMVIMTPLSRQGPGA